MRKRRKIKEKEKDPPILAKGVKSTPESSQESEKTEREPESHPIAGASFSTRFVDKSDGLDVAMTNNKLPSFMTYKGRGQMKKILNSNHPRRSPKFSLDNHNLPKITNYFKVKGKIGPTSQLNTDDKRTAKPNPTTVNVNHHLNTDNPEEGRVKGTIDSY